MAALDDVERLLGSLTRAQKAQVLGWLLRDLGGTFPGIESIDGVSGGEPCIAGTRIPVWLLEQARRLGMSDTEILGAYPALRAEDLAHAWAYVAAHQEEIEQQIRDNEAA